MYQMFKRGKKKCLPGKTWPVKAWPAWEQYFFFFSHTNVKYDMDACFLEEGWVYGKMCASFTIYLTRSFFVSCVVVGPNASQWQHLMTAAQDERPLLGQATWAAFRHYLVQSNFSDQKTCLFCLFDLRFVSRIVFGLECLIMTTQNLRAV